MGKLIKNKGFSVIEVMVAMAILVIALTAVITVVFGGQSFLLGGQTNAEALKKAQNLLEKAQSQARKDFNLVNPIPEDTLDADGCPISGEIDGIYSKKLCVKMQPDNLTKKVTAIVSWAGEVGTAQNISISTIVTKFTSAIGSDTCNSVVTSDWSTPSIINGTTDFATIIGDSTGTYTLTDIDVYGGKAYVTVQSPPATVNPGAGTDQSGVGTKTWNNPSNILSSDANYATVSLGGSEVTHYLKASNFVFNIPSSATILGIEVSVRRSMDTNGGISDSEVKIVKNGSIGGTNKADSSTWPTSLTIKNYGGSVDLWGESWTPTDINTNFGVVLSAKRGSGSSTKTASVDNISITVFYAKELYVLDVSDPSNSITLLNSLKVSTVTSGFNAVAIDGSYAYVATNSATNQFQIIDLSANPLTVIKTLSFPNSGGVGNSIYYKNGFVYLGLTTDSVKPGSEFHIIDVHSPASAFEVGCWPAACSSATGRLGHAINAISVSGDNVYLATPDSTEELHILDIIDKASPSGEPGHDAPGGGVGSGNGKSVFPVGDDLYFGRTVITGNSEFYALDASDLSSIITNAEQEVSESINGVVVRDYLAFLATKTKFKVYEIDSNVNPWTVNTTYAPDINLPGSGHAVEPALDCEGDTMYVVSNDVNGRGYLSIIAP